MNNIPPARPVMDKEMIENAVYALRNEMISMGESVYKFEEEFARFIGTKEAVSTNSGTMALLLSVIGAGIEKGEKVLTTPFTFIATSNAVIHAGAMPVFADISLKDYLLDPSKAEKELKKGGIKAIIPVHLYGKPADMERFMELKERYGVNIIEDACQAHGAYYGSKRAGSMGDFGTFSFYAIKNMTVGGDGGMVTLNDEDVAKKLRSIRDCGRKGKYEHIYVGYTARLNTVNAAIGRVQLRKLDSWNERRRHIASIYREKLKDVEEIVLPPEDDHDSKSVYHLFVIRTKKEGERDKLREYLKENGIGTGIHYPVANHMQPIYRDMFGYRGGEYPESERAAPNVLSIPMFPLLKDDEVGYVAEKIREFYGR